MRPSLSSIRAELPALLHLAVPLILGELGWMAMSVVDTIMVGRLPHSAVAMSAASLAEVLFNTVAFGIAGTLLGLDSFIAEAFGAKQVDEANRWLLHGLVLALPLSLLLVLLLFVGPQFLAHLPVDRAILAGAIPALRGLAWGAPPLLLYFTLRRYLQAAHHVRPVAFALVSANIINAALDWLLLYGHHWTLATGHSLSIPAYGVVGSSWATSLARLYMLAVLLVATVVVDRRHGYGLRATSRRLEANLFRQIVRLGLPAGGQIFVEIAVFATVTALIATFGPLPLAGHEVALTFVSTTFMVPFAISTATAVCVGNAIGSMRTQSPSATRAAAAETRAAAAGWAGILAGAAFMLCSAALLLAAPAQIARLFTPDGGVIAAAVPLLLIAAAFQFFDGVQITAGGALRGLGNTDAAFYAHLTAYWALGLPLGWWLAFPRHLGARGLWIGLLAALTCSASGLVIIWNRKAREFLP